MEAAIEALDGVASALATKRDDRLVVYVVGEELSAAWDEVRTAFGGEVPPATLLGVARLGHSGQLVEIDAHIERA